MYRQTLYILAVFSVVLYLVRAVEIRDQVIFHKTNEISTTRAKWLATIVSDFDEFSNFMSLVEKDIDRIEAGLDVNLNSFKINDTKIEAFRNVFEGLREETKYLRTLKENVETEVTQIMHQVHNSSQQHRSKRSLLPFVGEGLSWLFGVVSDRDLNEIRFQMNNLALNQKQIIHVFEKELSLINESRALIHENRQSIIEIVGSIRKLELTMKEIKRDFENQISTNRYVLEVYARLVLVMEEIKFLLRDARFYLIDLKSKLGYLSIGKISTDVIKSDYSKKIFC